MEHALFPFQNASCFYRTGTYPNGNNRIAVYRLRGDGAEEYVTDITCQFYLPVSNEAIAIKSCKLLDTFTSLGLIEHVKSVWPGEDDNDIPLCGFNADHVQRYSRGLIDWDAECEFLLTSHSTPLHDYFYWRKKYFKLCSDGAENSIDAAWDESDMNEANDQIVDRCRQLGVDRQKAITLYRLVEKRKVSHKKPFPFKPHAGAIRAFLQNGN